VLMPMQVV